VWNVKQEYRSVSKWFIPRTFFSSSVFVPIHINLCISLTGSIDAALTQPVLCDYSGHYFCSECHWGNLSVIPSRAVLNWDFQEYPVSKGSKQYLNLMMKKSIIKLESINPKLFSFVEELAYVKVNKIYCRKKL
jgi:hypothetical protein